MVLIYYHLPCSRKIFRNVFAFLYKNANSKENCKEISGFPSPFRKMLMSEFLLRFKANILWLPLFLFVDSNSPCKDLRFPHGLNWHLEAR